MSDNFKRNYILGIPVDMVDMQQAVSKLQKLLEFRSCGLIVTPNSEIVINAGDDLELLEIIRSADLIIPDGIGLVYASRLLGFPLKERVTGIDFLYRAFDVLAINKKSAYFLGGKPGKDNEPSVAELAAKEVEKKYPGMVISGCHHGYFNAEEEARIVEEINSSGTDFLCVGLGSPKQEKFIAKYQDQLKVKTAIGVGGSLDVLAGTVKRAPEFYRKHGLEWLYRFMREPVRYKRLAALPKFMIRVLISKKSSGENQ
ncbi:MAG TPA: WecB/TagA/CpsF family glycosyltransferase [Anaerovoracaceae bacterium]|nr:WecB/TagA/CpsF family glycosyltransferase [Anaerovoracaceae bacterium]